MTPVHQTKFGAPHGNCTAACVATLLDKPLEDVDVDVASYRGSVKELLRRIEEKAGCRIYGFPHEAIVDGVVKSSERYCFVEVCTSTFNHDPSDPNTLWHSVVCEIADDGRLSQVFNPDSGDQKRSLEQFKAMRTLFIVKRNKEGAAG